jgi:hypothetical protein
MCYFLTIAVPSKHADEIDRVFATKFQTQPTTNPSLLKLFAKNYAARLITQGGCFCDLYTQPRSATIIDPADRLRQKYKARGWSEAKIARAIEQVQLNAAASATAGLRSDVVERLQMLCQSAGGFALLVHWYVGDVESEPLSLTLPQACDPTQLSSRANSLREDQVLLVVPNRARE